MNYSMPIKSARMDAVRKGIDGGRLVLQTENGDAVSFPLKSPSGLAAGGLLVLLGFPRAEITTREGKLVAAKILNYLGEDAVTGLTVGKNAADILVDKDFIKVNDAVQITSAEFRHF